MKGSLYLAGVALVAAALALSSGCKPNPHTAQRPDSIRIDEDYLLSCRTLEAIPVPTVAAASLHKLAPNFRAELPLKEERVDYMHTGSQQALALGAFAADLAYANLYHHPLEATASLKALDRLALGLEVEDAIGTARLQKDLNRGVGSDSLLDRLNLGFSAMCTRFQSRGQLPLSVLVVAGGWVEGMHLLCETAAQQADAAPLRSLAASQKTSLDLLLEAWPEVDPSHMDTQAFHKLLVDLQTVLATATLRTIDVPGGGDLHDVNGIATYTTAVRTEQELDPKAFDRIRELLAQARAHVQQGATHVSEPSTISANP